MSELRMINQKALTPKNLLEFVAKDVDNLKHLYVVGINQNDDPDVWCTGDLRGIAMAALVLQDLGMKYLNNLVVEE